MTTTQAALLEALTRCVAGIEHLSELARQWEPDHSSRAEQRGWFLAQDAKDDAKTLIHAAALRAADAAQPEPLCWASPALALPDDEDEAKGWTARVNKTRNAVFSMPLYAAPPQPAPIAAQAGPVTAEQHFDFTPAELHDMRRNPYVLAQLMNYHDVRQSEADAMFDGDVVPLGNERRWAALYERGRSIIAEDLDVWPDDLRKQFGFPVAAQAGDDK